MTTYDALLSDWGKLVGLSLHLRSKPVCCVRIPNGLELHLDLDQEQDQLVLSIPLGTVPLGTYADELFCAALIHNGISKRPLGILSYSDVLHSFLLHEQLPLATCSAELLQERIEIVSSTATLWKNAIAQQIVPAIDEAAAHPSPLQLYPQRQAT